MATGGNNQTLSVTIGANMDPSGVLSAIKQMQGAFSGLKLPGDIGADLEKSFGKATDLLKKYQTQLSKGINTKTDAKNITKTGSQINEVLDEIVNHINSINGQQIFLKADVSGLNTLKTNIEDARTAWKNAIQEFRKGSDIEKVLNEIAEKTTRSNLTQGSISSAKTLFDKGDLEGYRNALDDIYNRLKNLKDTTIKNVVENLGLQDAGSKIANLEQIKKRLEDISKIDFSKDSNVDTKFKAITTAVTEYETEVKRASQAGQNAFNNINVNKTVKDTRDLVDATDQYKNSVMSAKDQVQQLQQSTQYFFSLRNMINLLKRGIREAVDVVKELDAAMTETAVVTDYSVGDMWQKLPEYTANANALGATVKDMYEATTLYYQQGLRTEAAMGIANETMKMARIGGLEASDATDKMTAALRGFNMEINEMSAQRVNDVYSNLAAKTASNTEELGTAMQRTASIAHSAGMSFEGTAAFLAQAIETTREPAENLGTAMKTIVARFTELKKNPLEITEVDGEEVSYNKVDTALQSIGVSLKDANGQFRDLDQVFLDISQRWDSLTQTQQRYVATTAAGSRQQSRFIAMMSNYERTMQLMDYANNSAGASNEQFGKTMESLEAKLNKLKNAWNEFLMNIMNDSWTKGIVDGGTKILNVVNNIIEALSFGGKAKGIKSALSLFTAFTALKATGRFANRAIGGLGGILDPSVGFGKGFLGGAIGVRQQASAAQAQMIYQPIVNELRALPARLKGQNTLTENGSQNTIPFNQQAFKQAKNNIAELTKYGQKYSADAVVKQFKGLNVEQQRVLRNTMIGTSNRIDTALLNRYGAQDKAQSKAIQIAASNYRNQAKIGAIAWNEYYNKVSDPVAMKKALDGNPKVSEATMEWVSGMADKTTDQAKANIAKAMEDKLYNSGAFDAVTNRQEYQKILNKAAEARWKEMSEAQQAAARRKAWRDMNPTEPLQNNTGTELLNGLGQIGAGISSAGMGLQSFGALLTSSANPALQAFGGALTAIGGVLSSVGMGLSGLISGFNVLANSGVMKGLAGGLSNLIGKQIPASAATGVLAGIAALTAIAVSAYKKHIQKLKDAGENVVKEYKEANEKYTSSINDLTTWQQELPRLQEGVDDYGNNVNLDTSDYERYREIINGIAELNPDIVEGYNAQGDAIIRNNSALDQTLAKQRELQKLATEDYLSQQSLATLIRARDTTDAFKKDKAAGGTESVVEAHNLISAMRQAGLGDSFFEALGFDYSKLQASHNNPEIQRFIMENEQIAREISEFYDQAGVDIDSHISEGLDNLTIAVDAEKEAIQDVYDNLMTYTSVNHLAPTNLPANLQGSFNKGVELIAKSRLGAVGMQKAIENLSKRYNVLTKENSQYNKIMEEVRSGQEEYSRTLDASGYKGEEYRNKLLALAEGEQELADKTDVLQDKIAHTNLAEFYTNEAEKAFSFTNKQITDLTDAFAQFTDEINIAKNAYTDWQKQLESLNSPEQGVNSYKQILDDVFKETEDSSGTKHQYNTEAKGRPELWTGAAQILSDDWMRGKDTDAVANKLKSLQPLFREGQEGAIALGDKIRDALQAGEEFDGHKFSEFFEITDKGVSVKDGVNISDELTDSLAHYWDMQTPALVAALQNASQYGISLMKSTADQRMAISNDVRASTGVKSHATDELGRDITDLIVPRDVLVEGFHAAGEYNEAVIREGIKTLRKEQGVFTSERVLATKNADKLQKEYGITQDNFLKVLGQHLGEDEVKETYEGYYGKGSWTNEQQTQYDEIQEGIQSTLEETTSEVPDIASSVANIEGMLAAKLYESGDATNFDKLNDFHKSIKGDEQLIDTATDKLVAAGADKEHQYTKKDFDQYYKDNESVLKASQTLIKQLEAGREKWRGQEDSEQYKSYSEQLKQAKADYEYALKAKENADNYAKEQGWDGSAQPPSFSEAQIQEKINSVVSAGWGQLLNGIPTTVLATPEAQQAMTTLTQNAFNLDMLSGPIAPEIQKAFSDLGIDIDEALQSGLEAWPNPKEAQAAIDKKGQELEQVGEEAGSSMLNKIDTSWIQKLTLGLIEKYQTSANSVGTTKPTINASPQKNIEHEQSKGQTRTEQLKTIFSSEGAEEVEQKEDEVKEKADKGAEHTTKFKAEDTGVENKLKKLGENKTSNVTVKATADTGGIDAAAKKSIAKPVTIDDKATPKIRQIDTAAKKPITKKINISPNYTGTWHKDFIINVKKRGGNDGAYTGLNNKISFYHVPQAGSLAAGTKKGRVGPKNRGGLTLTGEQGYEIVWLPSENKSAILGANGPQMVDLPKDATVYNHEQSKDIMKKRKGIPAGSTWSGSLPTTDSTGGGGGGGGNTTTAKTVGKTANHVKKKATEAAAAIKKVSVWWENIARKTEVAQRAQDNNQKAFEKYLKEMRATLRLTGESLESGGGGGDDYLTSIGKTLGYYEAQLEKVNKELNNLANGTAPADQKKRKEKYGEEGYENIAQISYKKGKKNKEELVDLAKYIKEEDGTFVVDQSALDAISSKEQRKAIADAANKEIDDRLSKKYKAEDEIEKAQEAIEKMGEELYETFFKWENELTKIWNITQKIEQTEARISQAKGYSDLLESQLSTGMATAGKEFAAQSLSAFRASLQQQSKQINLSFEALNQKKIDLSKLLSLDDEKKTLENVQKKIVEGIDDQGQIAKLQEELANKQAVVSGLEEKIAKGDAAIASIDADIAETEPKTKKGKKKNKKKAQKKLNKLNVQKEETIKQKGEYEAQRAEAVKEYKAAKAAYDETKSNTINDTERLGYEEYAKQLENNIAMQARAWDFMSAKQLADGTLDVKFDSDAFETEKLAGNITEEQGKQIQDYVKSIVDGSKELTQQYTDTTSLINDMYGSLNNLQDAWAGYAEELWQISDEQQRKEVDNLKKLSDSLSDTFKNLIDDVKRKLDQRRQQEDNAKTEQDISKKQQRLAALRADTSGGHQVEIAQLQQEIADAQQTYQRSLEDQLLDNLQQQADLAAQQRERQIALQEAMISEINNAAMVNEWMNNPEEYKDKIYKAFCEANDYDKKPEALQKQLDTKFETLFNGLLTNQEEQQLVAENISLLEGKAEEVRAELEQFTALEGAINQLANVIGQLSNSNIAQDVTKPTGLTTEQTTASQIAAAQTTPNTTPTSSEPAAVDDPAKKAYEEIIAAAHKKKTVDKSTFVDAVNKGKAIGYDVAKVAKDLAEGDGKGGVTWDETVKAAKKAGYAKSVVAKWSTDAYLAKAIKKWSKFKTGGLADYTGPAWLDGTPSKPELVLNSTDTKNFLALRDVLSNAMNSMNTVSNSYGGDTLYEININVDKIEKDYDVDRVVEKVKKEITKGAGYRNVTQVRNLR